MHGLFFGAGAGVVPAMFVTSALNLSYPDNIPVAVVGMVVGAVVGVGIAINETRSLR